MSKETQKGEVITGHRWSWHLAPSPLAILCHIIHMIILEKSMKQWNFFLKTLGLDFFLFIKEAMLEYLVQSKLKLLFGEVMIYIAVW